MWDKGGGSGCCDRACSFEENDVKWLITGGAGFIGSNSARRLLADGHDLVIFDDLSRPGADANLKWLHERGPFTFIRGDIRDFGQVVAAFAAHRNADIVLHLAGQVAVTKSVAAPRSDFELNALGTFNVCEAVRQLLPSGILLNASTNKVYGAMPAVGVIERDGRYQYRDLPHGIPETQPLDFHSPYGCSKGSADQYVSDYARIYGLRTVNLRQSCVYGPRQFGAEDQGWVAWFIIAATLQRPITIYGDGRQVRDILFVDDLVDCYLAAIHHVDRASGQSYNVGGGAANAISPLELIAFLEGFLQRRISPSFAAWRPGDQRVFICDVRRAARELDWAPTTSKDDGLVRLAEWVAANMPVLRDSTWR